jgi:hypothetical protein
MRVCGFYNLVCLSCLRNLDINLPGMTVTHSIVPGFHCENEGKVCKLPELELEVVGRFEVKIPSKLPSFDKS